MRDTGSIMTFSEPEYSLEAEDKATCSRERERTFYEF
jgi:hypothetical protein